MFRHRSILRPLIPIVLAGTVGSAAVAFALRDSSPQHPTSVLGGQLVNGNNGKGNADDAAKSFVVAGDVEGLAPGVTRPLTLRLSNPNSGAISVETLSVTVGNSPTGCAGSFVRVGALGGPIFLSDRGSAQTTLPVTMLPSAPAACEGATFSLTYAGSAVKA